MLDGGAQYDVGIKLHKVGDGWDDLSSGVGKFTGLINGAVGTLARMGSMAAFGLAAAGIAGLSHGVTSLNANAEKAAISIGTIFSVNGAANGVPAGIKLAGDTIAKMRIDAQKLPGEFEDLQTIFTMGATSALRSGLGVDKWREMSANAMAAGATLMMPMDQVAREMTQLLEGHAGSHNVFGGKMGFTGDSAKKLNAMSMDKRADAVGKELTKFSGALDIFAMSWDGLTSTFIDNVKNFGRAATGPLFESLKGTLAEVNAWFSSNQSAVNSFASTLGTGIRDAFEWGKATMIEWYPIVENFVETAWNRMKDFWDDIRPAVSGFAQAFRDALSDPNGTIDKLHDLFVMWAAIQGGSMLLGAGGAVGGVAKGLGGGIGWALGAKATETGALALGGAGAGGGALALGGGAAAVGAAALAALAAWGVATWQAVELADEINAQQMADSVAVANGHARDVKAMRDRGETEEWISLKMSETAQKYADSGDTVGWALNDVATAAANAAAGLNALGERGPSHTEVEGDKRMGDIADKAASDMMLVLKAKSQGMKGWEDANEAAKKTKPHMKGGHGGTSVQKVEIVITSNQNPSRIAQVIKAELSGLSTNKRFSPDVRNFSAPDEA